MDALAVEKKGILLSVLREFLLSQRSLSEAAMEKKIGKEKLEEMTSSVWDFLDQSVQGNLTRNERSALLFQTTRCLVRWMGSQEIPVTLNTLVNNFHLLPFAVERDFPFYAKSKLLRYVIQGAKTA